MFLTKMSSMSKPTEKKTFFFTERLVFSFLFSFFSKSSKRKKCIVYRNGCLQNSPDKISLLRQVPHLGKFDRVRISLFIYWESIQFSLGVQKKTYARFKVGTKKAILIISRIVNSKRWLKKNLWSWTSPTQNDVHTTSFWRRVSAG